MKYLIFLLTFLLFVACKKDTTQEEPSITIMRIGTAVLTERDVVSAIGANASPEQKLNYIRNWSDKELAYQAAVESGLDREAAIKQTINNMIKGFLSVQFIQQEIGKIGAVEVFADDIEREFIENAHKYTRKEPVVRVARITTTTRMEAWRAREGLTAENFRARGSGFSTEAIPPFENIIYAPRSDFHPESFNTIFNSRVSSITLPLQEDEIWAIYLILGKEDVGSPSLLEEVIDDVKRNVLTRKQNNVVRSIYENLRNRYDYSYNREYIAKLETQQNISVSAPVSASIPMHTEEEN